MKNFYNILGVREDCSLQEINEAYKKLAQKFHPDKNNDDPYFLLLFQQITEAKNTLTNTKIKEEYDLQLSNYMDAHSLLLQQIQENGINKQQKRQHQRKVAQKRKHLKILGVVTLFLASVLLVVEETRTENYVERVSNKLKKPFQEVLAEHKNKERNKGPESSGVAKSEADSTIEKLINRINEDTNIRFDVSQSESSPKKEELKSMKDFSKQDLTDILHTINSEKIRKNIKVNCITIRKTKNSNVDPDFNIANFFVEKGFVISGRETVVNEIRGIKIDISSPCIILTIGII